MFKGLNLGIDFEGGSQVNFETPSRSRSRMCGGRRPPIAGADAVVQGRGTEQNGGYTEFQIKTESLTAAEQTELTRALESDLGAERPRCPQRLGELQRADPPRGASSPSSSRSLLIVIYVTIRFEFIFALPIFRALFYDVTVAMGVYALVGWEVTAATVAAILTILGYSMYDTIIIFDRVRENIPLMRKSSFAAIANQSLWETIRRSLATSFITLLPITALILFGGDTLKEFAFALLIGIASGAFSTVFIATPLPRRPQGAGARVAQAQGRGAPGEARGAGGRVGGRPSRARRGDAGGSGAGAVEAEPVAVPEAVAPTRPRRPRRRRREARRKRRRARPHGRAR